jgi:thiol:disulfide interchange protein DsbC
MALFFVLAGSKTAVLFTSVAINEGSAMRIQKLSSLVAGLLMSVSAAAQVTPINEANGIDEVLKLPVNGLSMIRSGDTTMLVSDNGRFVMRAEIYDMWNGGRKLTTLDDIREYGSRIDLASMTRFSVDDLYHVSYGDGEREVMMFIDPMCQVCHQAIGQIAELHEEYTFNLVVLPMLGERSQQVSLRLACKEDQLEAQEAVMQLQFAALEPARDDTCGREKLMRNMVTAKQFGVTGVPFVIADDGRTMRGLKVSVGEFLNSTRSFN